MNDLKNVYRIAVCNEKFGIEGGISAPFYTLKSVCDEANIYLSFNPNDIVMLLELEMAKCKHCDQKIIEKAGWVLHKWIHLRSGAHLCWLQTTQAEPKEDE